MPMRGGVTDPTIPAAGGKRILFYGGCHAGAFAKLFQRYCEDPTYSFEVITNFEIIRKAIPFRYDAVGQWDAVVFSPIANKPGYETYRLIDACNKAGVPCISYPWLEWRGYFPGIVNTNFLTGQMWHYPDYFSDTVYDDDLTKYKRNLSSIYSGRGYILEKFQETTEVMRSHEDKHDCTVRASDYILEHYKKRRLFLTPNHPGQPLYQEMIRRINAHLRVPLDESVYYTTVEVQAGIKIPIHPAVSEALGLNFIDADYQNSMSPFGRKVLSFTDYVTLCRGFGRGARMFEATSNTVLKMRPVSAKILAPEEQVNVAAGTVLQISRDAPVEGGHYRIKPLWAGRGLEQKIAAWTDIFLFKGHWRDASVPLAEPVLNMRRAAAA